MKKLLALTIVFCLLATPATPVIAQTRPGPGTPLLFNSQPDFTWQKIEGGSILVITADNNTYYILNTEKKPFPPGTESGKKLRPDNKWEIYTQLPGQTNWQIVTTDMVAGQPDETSQPLPPGVIPQGMGQKAEPHSIISGFPTGYPTVTPAIEKQLEPVAEVCKKNDVFCIVEGQASQLSYGSCYVDMEAGYIAPPSGHKAADYPNAKLIKGNRNCNEALGQFRAKNTASKLVQMGVPRERVFWLTHASWGMREGTNYANQAVVVFVIARTKIDIKTPGPVIGGDTPAVECPTCPPTEPPIINIQGDCVVANRQNNNGRWEVTVICFRETPPPSQPAKAEDECWKWALGGGLVGGGLGYGVSELDIQGGKGGGNAGDGGSVSICGDNPVACILGGMAAGAGAAYLYCKTKQWIKKAKEENK